MSRQTFLTLASQGHCMPVGADMTLHSHADAHDILFDAKRLGEVIAETARTFNTPVALPVMDLTVEKNAALAILGIPEEKREKYHFEEPLTKAQFDVLDAGLANITDTRMRICANAVGHVAKNHPDLVPVGMAIGPFSLMTKLVSDPITAVYLAGSGSTAEEEEEIALVESALELATRTILASLKLQIEAGVKAVFICEPAANTVYLSPHHTGPGTEVFERYVLSPNRRIVELLDAHGVDLLFHDCGELTLDFIRSFAQELHPAVLSFGSPVKLWEAATVVPQDIVLFGNLPSKKFFSDDELPVDKLSAMATDLLDKMRAAGHPFILASECDILSVPGKEAIIRKKINAFLEVGRAWYAQREAAACR